MTAYTVLPYDIGNLVQCFTNASEHATSDSVKQKRQCDYFEKYFNTLDAKTIVVETVYTDKDYLEDYAAYYDRCFQDYPRRTQRLHFFNASFDDSDFQAILVGNCINISEDEIKASYLGFIVAKPLPQTIIGRTCLRTYPSDNGRRQFPSLRTYNVNLFGIALNVESLAYQEQDTVVAACATSALWSCFQGTGKLFQHHIPPPVEITNWAGSHMPENLLTASSRAFPNSGLTPTQMAMAIKKVGLEPFVTGTYSPYSLNSLAYAYLKGRIPSILAAKLIQDPNTPNERILGGHAIAITGFSLDELSQHRYTGSSSFKLRASKIAKFYGHDDQVGPFARMAWTNVTLTRNWDGSSIANGPQVVEALDTSWTGNIFLVPDLILLPLYHKIRIPFSLIHDTIFVLDAMVESLRSVAMPNLERVEWDIFLTTASEYKSSIRNEYKHLPIDLKHALLANMPRFMWRVTARMNSAIELDFLFDATGIAQHDLLIHVASTGGTLAQMIAAVAVAAQTQGTQTNIQVNAIFKRFLFSSIKP